MVTNNGSTGGLLCIKFFLFTLPVVLPSSTKSSTIVCKVVIIASIAQEFMVFSMSNHAKIDFNESGVPISQTFDDIYFSIDSGIDESQYVFLKHNGLPERWVSLPAQYDFVVTETGFGTGLNFLLTWLNYRQHARSCTRLHFISVEKYPLSKSQLAQALATLPAVAAVAEPLLEQYPATEPGCHRLVFDQGRVVLDLWIGDIIETLAEWQTSLAHQVDAWFLDGFAPAKNPAMWQSALFNTMANSAHRDTTFATFTAAGMVKRGLNEAGFQVNKVKGFGRKREMLCGHFPGQIVKSSRCRAPVTLVGGGIASACLARALHQRQIPCRVISQGLADGASGNPQGAVYPLLHAELTPLTRFYLQASSTAISYYTPWRDRYWFVSGVIQPAFNASRIDRIEKITACDYSSATVTALASELSSTLAQLPIEQPSLHYPNAGWLNPSKLVRAMFNESDSDWMTDTVERIFPSNLDSPTLAWTLVGTRARYSAARVVIACGHASATLFQSELKMTPVKGQISTIRATAETEALNKVLCYKGYMVPAQNGEHCIGATFERGQTDLNASVEADTANCDSLARCAQQTWSQHLEVTGHRVSIRATTPDHMPAAGALDTGLMLLSGLGSRGLTAAPILAELLAEQLSGGVVPLTKDARSRLQPQRLIK